MMIMMILMMISLESGDDDWNGVDEETGRMLVGITIRMMLKFMIMRMMAKMVVKAVIKIVVMMIMENDDQEDEVISHIVCNRWQSTEIGQN